MTTIRTSVVSTTQTTVVTTIRTSVVSTTQTTVVTTTRSPFTIFNNQNVRGNYSLYYTQLSNSPYVATQTKCQRDCLYNDACKMFGFVISMSRCFVYGYANGVSFVNEITFRDIIMGPYDGINHGYKIESTVVRTTQTPVVTTLPFFL